MRNALCEVMGASFTVLGAVVAAPVQPTVGRCVELVAEKTLSVGRICVTERSDTLFVRFEATADWRLTETQLAVASDLEGIPLAGGRQPILGRFPYKDKNLRNLAAFGYAIPFSALPTPLPDTLVIAAHASVVADGMEEGAWAKGPGFAGEGNPATYFVYRRSGSGSGDRSLAPGSSRMTRAGSKRPPLVAAVVGARLRAGDRTRTGDVQLGKLAFYH